MLIYRKILGSLYPFYDSIPPLSTLCSKGLTHAGHYWNSLCMLVLDELILLDEWLFSYLSIATLV